MESTSRNYFPKACKTANAIKLKLQVFTSHTLRMYRKRVVRAKPGGEGYVFSDDMILYDFGLMTFCSISLYLVTPTQKRKWTFTIQNETGD